MGFTMRNTPFKSMTGFQKATSLNRAKSMHKKRMEEQRRKLAKIYAPKGKKKKK